MDVVVDSFVGGLASALLQAKRRRQEISRDRQAISIELQPGINAIIAIPRGATVSPQLMLRVEAMLPIFERLDPGEPQDRFYGPVGRSLWSLTRRRAYPVDTEEGRRSCIDDVVNVGVPFLEEISHVDAYVRSLGASFSILDGVAAAAWLISANRPKEALDMLARSQALDSRNAVQSAYVSQQYDRALEYLGEGGLSEASI